MRVSEGKGVWEGAGSGEGGRKGDVVCGAEISLRGGDCGEGFQQTTKQNEN